MDEPFFYRKVGDGGVITATTEAEMRTQLPLLTPIGLALVQAVIESSELLGTKIFPKPELGKDRCKVAVWPRKFDVTSESVAAVQTHFGTLYEQATGVNVEWQ